MLRTRGSLMLLKILTFPDKEYSISPLILGGILLKFRSSKCVDSMVFPLQRAQVRMYFSGDAV
jgi:hypothetical protein